MANIIPRPMKTQELEEKIWFSKKTVISGEFADVTTLFERLVPEAQEAEENNLM